MEYSSEQEKVIDDGEDEGWVDTHHFSEKSSVEEKVSEMKLDEDEDGPTATDPDSDEEAVDMEAFAESGMLRMPPLLMLQARRLNQLEVIVNPYPTFLI